MIGFMEPRLNKSLTAYRKRNSCETTLVKLAEDWKTALDEKNVVGILSTDLSKAFDSLHPPLLLAKLKAYRFADSAMNLLRSYFTERRNRVRIGGDILSEWQEVGRRCSQGSNLGPLLWNIFQNDLVHIMNKSSLIMYADDHQGYSCGKKIKEVEEALNDEGRNIADWYKNNLLMCNQDKFQSMSLGPMHKNKEMNISMMNKGIERKSEMKLLGVSIDENLNFSDHIRGICSKGPKKVGVLMRLTNMLPTIAKLRICKSFILPQLSYCHTVSRFGH